MIMIKLDDLRPIFIGLAMSFKILGSTASRPIFLQLIARPINLGWIYPILYQTWVKDAIGVPSYVNEVKGHIPRSRVIWGQVRWKMLVFVIWVSFEKLKSDWDQTWFMDIKWEPSLCWWSQGHILRSKVIWGQVGRKVKNEKFVVLGLLWKVEVRLEPNLVYGYKMGTFICWWGQGHILRSKVIWGQVGRKVENEKLLSFEKLKSD